MESRVRIYKRDEEWVLDTGGRPVPRYSYLANYLPPLLRDRSCHYGSVIAALVDGVSPQLLSLALAAYYTEHPNVGEVRVPGGECTIPDNTAYMALGDFIYKMVPVRKATNGRAIRAMREKMKAEEEHLRIGLRTQAQQEAQGILSRANEEVSRAKEALYRERLEAISVPSWALGRALFIGEQDNIFIQCAINVFITKLSHGEKCWDALPAPSFCVDMWLPLSAECEQISVASSPASPTPAFLPHVGRDACISLGERRGPIRSLKELESFANAISRALQVINLASLLYPDISKWHPSILPFIPSGLKSWLETHLDRASQESGESLPPSQDLERREAQWAL